MAMVRTAGGIIALGGVGLAIGGASFLVAAVDVALEHMGPEAVWSTATTGFAAVLGGALLTFFGFLLRGVR